MCSMLKEYERELHIQFYFLIICHCTAQKCKWMRASIEEKERVEQVKERMPGFGHIYALEGSLHLSFFSIKTCMTDV